LTQFSYAGQVAWVSSVSGVLLHAVNTRLTAKVNCSQILVIA
jgi:hypothetical protein